MMIFDLAYKIIRKSLPSNLYSIIKRSKFGREQEHYTLDTYKEIYNYFLSKGLKVKGKQVCELGSGLQFFTAFFMLNDGAEKVILIDPVFSNNDNSTLLLEQYNLFKSKIKSSVDFDLNRIQYFKFLKDLDGDWNKKLDIICSHYVLEHFKNLESFFSEAKRLLKFDGESLNRVDLSDHTYHVLGKYPFIYKYIDGREIDYYKYSEKIFSLINDEKCYMNRIPLPVYLRLAERFNLKVEKIETTSVGSAAKPHIDVLNKYRIEYSELLQTVNFTLHLRNE